MGACALGTLMVRTPAFLPRSATAACSELVLAVQPIPEEVLTRKDFQFRQAGCS